MKTIIDTSSLRAVTKYYVPFDSEKVLYLVLKDKIESSELLFLEEIFNECRFQMQSLIVNTFDFLKEKSSRIQTEDLIATKKFYNLVDDHFCYKDKLRLRDINQAQYEARRTGWMNEGDAKVILKAYTLKKNKESVRVLSEESMSDNDGKLFKKIPFMCRAIGIDCITLSDYLDELSEIDVRIESLISKTSHL